MTNYISIKQILDDLLDHPMLQGLTLERAINYAIRFIQIVGMPNQFEEKVSIIEIKDYRGVLPDDFYEMIQVRTHKEGDKNPRTYKYAENSFHYSSGEYDNKLKEIFTYKIQNNVIYTSTKDLEIEISYWAIPVDNMGFPLIPENSSFITALELYIKKQYFTILFDTGKLNPNVLQNVQQEYAWYVGQAQSDLIRPTIDQMQSITNMWNTLIPRVTEHEKGFYNAGSREYLKVNT